jgi:hypothetical protein
MMRYVALAFWMLLLVGCSGGYSFTGGSVGAAKSFSVGFFPNRAPLVNPNLSIQLTETIKDIFIRQTPLKLLEGDADMLVEGSIVGYDVKPISAQGDETTSQSRFTITISVTFTNNLEPEKSFNQRFSRFRDFSSDNLFADVENQLVSEINQELAEDVLNRAIANW